MTFKIDKICPRPAEFSLRFPKSDRLLGGTYEKVARETLISHVDDFFPFAAIGRWWGRTEEIDVVAVNRDHDSILFCEVKATEKPVGTDILDALKEKSRKVKWGSADRKEYYCLFSRKGFTPGLLEQARKEGVVLFREDQS